MKSKQYLIADARKEQIIKAAIEVLTDIGYVSTSLSKIASKAKTSTGLISYHFSGKEDLMNHIIVYLVEEEKTFIRERVEMEQTNMGKLMAFVEAGIEYRNIKRGNITALLEIVFNIRTPDNVPYFKGEMNPEEEVQVRLEEILVKGQESNEFGDFDTKVVGIMIRGSISSAMSLPQDDAGIKDYGEKVKENILKMIK
ncbi:TetR family transcriptional regulator [Bacillus mangrovi]|uniref:TetR family transcriptional regulator n=1 Tax=Metabacillus mangrovi TaxID=1491830 RepID=A0A7X2S9X5_9BACI|nr:TetR/AcrR family transcriptional regulator [Metabacillus mangrovi]MTH55795.1 TetR family transcriptional regulator [Metabacillus mangrovi]